jgi:cysteine synthase
VRCRPSKQQASAHARELMEEEGRAAGGGGGARG